MDIFYILAPIMSSYERMLAAGQNSKNLLLRSAKLDDGDRKSPEEPAADFRQLMTSLFPIAQTTPFPNTVLSSPATTTMRAPDGGEILASDQHPDHNVQEGEKFIASIYNAIRGNPAVWDSTALLVVYDEHGGIYDHVAPPHCTPDDYPANQLPRNRGAV